jgi:hypothetical protein
MVDLSKILMKNKHLSSMICVKIDVVIMISTLRGLVEDQNLFARYNMLQVSVYPEDAAKVTVMIYEYWVTNLIFI